MNDSDLIFEHKHMNHNTCTFKNMSLFQQKSEPIDQLLKRAFIIYAQID